MTKVFLDMDGVISDFRKAYDEISHHCDDLKFKEAVRDHEIFTKLDFMPNAQSLLNLLFNDLQVEVEILSSLGTHDAEIAELARQQKEHWLNMHGILCKRNFVNSWAYKHRYAVHQSVMIDDRHDVIENFVTAGGLGVIYSHEDWGSMEYKIRQAVTRAKQLGVNSADLHIQKH